jgi:hypothetical protein
VAAGIGALLNELTLRKRGRTLFSDEMRAILIHSALSPRLDNGPTYDAGWGVVMGVQAANIILGEDSSLERRTLGKGGVADIPLEWWDGRDARVTVVWLDGPGSAVAEKTAVLDDVASTLVDRLVIALYAPDGSEHFPWSLNPKAPSAPPTRSGPNQIDNVIRFDVPQTRKQAGQWLLRIDAANVASEQMSVAIAYHGLRPSR